MDRVTEPSSVGPIGLVRGHTLLSLQIKVAAHVTRVAGGAGQ